MTKIDADKLLKWLKREKRKYFTAGTYSTNPVDQLCYDAAASAYDDAIAHVKQMKLNREQTLKRGDSNGHDRTTH